MSLTAVLRRIRSRPQRLDGLERGGLDRVVLRMPLRHLLQRQMRRLCRFLPIPVIRNSAQWGLTKSIFCTVEESNNTALKSQPHLFSLTLTPVSGSLHSKSHINPTSGTSHGLCKSAICCNLSISGLNPPCMHKIFSSTIALTGRQLNTSLNTFHSRIEYLLLHSS